MSLRHHLGTMCFVSTLAIWVSRRHRLRHCSGCDLLTILKQWLISNKFSLYHFTPLQIRTVQRRPRCSMWSVLIGNIYFSLVTMISCCDAWVTHILYTYKFHLFWVDFQSRVLNYTLQHQKLCTRKLSQLWRNFVIFKTPENHSLYD